MDDFLEAPYPAARAQAPDLIEPLFHAAIVPIPLDGRLAQLQDLGLPLPRIFSPVMQNPDEYLQPRRAPFVELPEHWQEFAGLDYFGLQQYLQEEWEAGEHGDEEDMGREEYDDDVIPTAEDRRLMKDIESSSSPSSSWATIGIQDSAKPDASAAAFAPLLDPVPTRTSDKEIKSENQNQI